MNFRKFYHISRLENRKFSLRRTNASAVVEISKRRLQGNDRDLTQTQFGRALKRRQCGGGVNVARLQAVLLSLLTTDERALLIDHPQ